MDLKFTFVGKRKTNVVKRKFYYYMAVCTSSCQFGNVNRNEIKTQLARPTRGRDVPETYQRRTRDVPVTCERRTRVSLNVDITSSGSSASI